MLKVDPMKTFDSIWWDFIMSTLQAINVPRKFIKWIEECITTPTFSVSVNGIAGDFFKSTKGLQGDPLSPFLFVFAMKIFSKLLSEPAKLQGRAGRSPMAHRQKEAHNFF